MMKTASAIEAKMWGKGIIGFGKVHYKYESGHQGDICLMGFSPRKQNFSLYLPGGHKEYADDLKLLGKYKTGKGCLYINKLSDIDTNVLMKMLKKGIQSSNSKK